MLKELCGRVGQSLFSFLADTSRLWELTRQVFRYFKQALTQPKIFNRERVFVQLFETGVASIGIVCLLGVSVGMILALQAAYQLEQFGQVNLTARLVSVMMVRELGPLIAAIIICGRIGARMAAELGTMKVGEEVDALTVMGIDPIRFLVVPRVFALLVMLPCLTIICDVMGMLGGFLIGTLGSGINVYLYIENNFDALIIKDISTGLVKSVIFSLVIAIISCYEGLSVRGGADAVGKATTQAVVNSIILIIILDSVTTAVFFYAFQS